MDRFSIVLGKPVPAESEKDLRNSEDPSPLLSVSTNPSPLLSVSTNPSSLGRGPVGISYPIPLPANPNANIANLITTGPVGINTNPRAIMAPLPLVEEVRFRPIINYNPPSRAQRAINANNDDFTNLNLDGRNSVLIHAAIPAPADRGMTVTGGDITVTDGIIIAPRITITGSSQDLSDAVPKRYVDDQIARIHRALQTTNLFIPILSVLSMAIIFLITALLKR